MNVHDTDAPRLAPAGTSPRRYDAILIVSYGGPEGPEDVLPFLENATRDRGVPRGRLLEVAEHYYHLGGRSPINDQNRSLVAALHAALESEGHAIPVHLGNRNWHPYIEDTVRDMRDAGVRRALAIVTSAFGSYSSCRQYREDLSRSCERIGVGAPSIDKLRLFYNHPGFVEAQSDHLRSELASFPPERRRHVHVVFTAHSIPVEMARRSRYEEQLREASRLVAEASDATRWVLAWQSRSGSPRIPWLEPDVGDVIASLAASGTRDVVVVPIGFLSDHVEVLYDLDLEARERAHAVGLSFRRARTVGTHPRFVAALRELVLERMAVDPVRRALGELGPSHDVCPADCCYPTL